VHLNREWLNDPKQGTSEVHCGRVAENYRNCKSILGSSHRATHIRQSQTTGHLPRHDLSVLFGLREQSLITNELRQVVERNLEDVFTVLIDGD
jgi:transposase